jgi:hypothetical protein
MNKLVSDIQALLESRNQLAKQAFVQYQPIVEKYINDNCTDSNQIAYTLDFMLDFCFDEQMMLLYRRLCRHLFSFDTETTVFYINAYRKIWDEEGTKFGNGNQIAEIST